MSAEINVYLVGPEESHEDPDDTVYDDFEFRKSTTKNMDKLWAYFYKNQAYPEYYLGIAKRVAICKCPITGEEQWFNRERNLKVENPVKGSTITVYVQIKTRNYTRDFIFMGWLTTPVHEWKMSKGKVFMLEQKFIDGLLPQDKRYLKINR
jgi:hypothetical protein